MALFELQNITFKYEDEKNPTIKDFSLTIEKGEVIRLVGENGSGKTTLLKILGGLLYPQKGTFLFENKVINEKTLKDSSTMKSFHKNIGFLFQNPDVMLFNSRVYDEVAFGPRQMGLSEEEVDKRTKDCLKLLGIESLSDKAPYHLSGGQKKRVAIASILSLNPDVYILDEPFNDLDEKGIQMVSNLFSDLSLSGKTIIYVNHTGQGDVVNVQRSVPCPEECPLSCCRKINLSNL